MRRRDFITLLGGTAAAWPLATHAQQPAKLPTIGYLAPGTPEIQGRWWAAFVEQLRVLGWIEGRNVAIEHRWAEGRSERYTEIAAEFVRLNVEIIITDGSTAIAAAKRATPVIPIVFAAAGDPVATGLVASLARPGGNVTGMSLMSSELGAKRLELLREVLPRLSRVAVLWNVDNPYSALVFKLTQAAGRTMGIEVRSLEVGGPDDFDTAFEAARGLHPDALTTVEDPLTVLVLAGRKRATCWAALWCERFRVVETIAGAEGCERIGITSDSCCSTITKETRTRSRSCPVLRRFSDAGRARYKRTPRWAGRRSKTCSEGNRGRRCDGAGDEGVAPFVAV
jgi:putative tryptophan/tyrosine transport system substrate-binding protein